MKTKKTDRPLAVFPILQRRSSFFECKASGMMSNGRLKSPSTSVTETPCFWHLARLPSSQSNPRHVFIHRAVLYKCIYHVKPYLPTASPFLHDGTLRQASRPPVLACGQDFRYNHSSAFCGSHTARPPMGFPPARRTAHASKEPLSCSLLIPRGYALQLLGGSSLNMPLGSLGV